MHCNGQNDNIDSLGMALAVKGGSIKAYLDKYVRNYEEKDGAHVILSGGKTLAGYCVYRKKDGFKSKDTTITAEILWRLMNHGKLFKYDSLLAIRLEIAYRESVIAATEKLGSLRSGSDEWNPDYWDGNNILQEGKDAFEAVQNIKNYPEKYRTASWGGAYFAHLIALMKAYQEAQRDMNSAKFAAFLRDPQVQSRMSEAKDDWIPGDWGCLNDTTIASIETPSPTGQSIIYLGGYFQEDDAFKNNARFWGHSSGTLTLKQWISKISNEDYGTIDGVAIESSRYRLRLPKPEGPGLYSDPMISPGTNPKIPKGTLP